METLKANSQTYNPDDNNHGKSVIKIYIPKQACSNDLNDYTVSLVQKLQTQKNFKVHAFIQMIAKLQHPRGGMVMNKLGKNLFLFQIQNEQDKARVLMGEACYFDNNVVVLHAVKGFKIPSEIVLNHILIQIRTYDLPLDYRVE